MSPAWNSHGYFIVLTLIIRLAGVNDPWLRQKLEISILIRTGPAAKLLSWHKHNRCQMFCFFCGKFEKHCFIVSRDILYSVLYHIKCSCKPHDIITFLICIIQKRLFLVFTHMTFALTTVAIRHVGAQKNALSREITVRK